MKNSKIIIILSILIMLTLIIPSSFASDLEFSSDDSAVLAMDSSTDLSVDDLAIFDEGSYLNDESDLADKSDWDDDLSLNDLSIEESDSEDLKVLSSGVNVDEGISVDSDTFTLVENDEGYINGTLYWLGIYGGSEFCAEPVDLTYTYTGDDGNMHTGTFAIDDDTGRFSLDLTLLPNLGKSSSPYTVVISCEDETYYFYNDDYPDSVSVTVNVVESGDVPPSDNPTLYVSTSGNDNTGDGTEANPYATVQKAFDVANGTDYEYDIIVKEGRYYISYDLSNKNNLNLIGVGDVIFDFDHCEFLIDARKGFAVSNITFVNAYGTSGTYAPIKSTSSLGEYLKVTNCKFINCSGVWAGAISTYYGGAAKLTVSNSTFINCAANQGGAISVSYSKTAIITGCTFINNSASSGAGAIYFANSAGGSKVMNSVFIGNQASTFNDIYSAGSITADNNYWTTNAKPGTDAVSSNVVINNWVLLDLTADLSKVAVDDSVEFTFDFTKYTDGTNNYTLETPIPDFDFTLAADLGSFDNTALTTVNGIATATYTAEAEGVETVTINGFDWEGITFDVIGNENNVIYVATNGSDSTGIGTEARPYATIEKALSQVTDVKNTIYIKKGTYNEVDLEINKNLVIIGEDRDTTIINALNNGRIFIITEMVNVELKSISLTNAKPNYEDDDFERAGKGGAILVEYGDLTLNNTSISNSKSSAGAVASIASAAGSLTIVDSVFENNTIDNDAFDVCYFDTIGGAAIYTDSPLVVKNSVFNRNIAQTDGVYDEGGAIYIDASSTIEECTFENNAAKNGGAIFIDTFTNLEINIANNVFKSNSATLGGAIYSSKSKFTTISNNEFDSNIASSKGGAIYVYGQNAVDLIDSNVFANNRANYGAALYLKWAKVTLNNNTMTDNVASLKGDAIYTESAYLNTNLTFLDNDTLTTLVSEDVSLFSILTDDMGNPIANANITFKLNDDVVGVAKTDNDGIARLTCYAGDDLGSYPVSGSFDGSSEAYPCTIKDGLLEVSKYYWFIGTQGYFTLQDAVDGSQEGDVIIGLPGVYTYEEINIGHRVNRIYKNVTIKAENLGDIILTSENGRLFNVAYQFYGDDSHRPSALVLENLIIENCTDEYGGAIYNDAYLTLENCIFRNNKGTNPDTSSKWHGGAIMSWGLMTINNCTFVNNTATSGGAINTEAIHGDGSVMITNTIFENNTVVDTGGAIYFSGYYDALVDNCSFTNNKGGVGGAIFTYTNLTIRNTPFINNVAENAGGAIYQYTKNLTMDNITVEGSTAQWGGALYLAPALTSTVSEHEVVYQVGIFNITNSKFNNNNASIDGGAIYEGYSFISTGFIKNSNFTNNNALGNGGAISVQISNCTIEESNFINNTARIGGLIYNNGSYSDYYGTEYASNVMIYNSQIENANASSDGGAIYNENQYSYVVLRDSSFKNIVSGGYGGVIYNGGNLDLSNNTMENTHANVGNCIYNNYSVKTAYLTFMNNDTVEFNMRSNSSIDLLLTITDDKNNSIVGKDIVFYINGELASPKVDITDDETRYPYTIPSPSEYLVSGLYSGSENGEYVINTGLIIALMPNESHFVIDQSDLYVGDNFTAKLLDESNEPIVNQTVNIVIVSQDGITEKSLLTDASGQIVLSDLPAGDYQINGTFAGNNVYANSNFTYNLTIRKIVPTLTIKAIGNEFIATLSNKGIPLEGKELHIRLIDGKGETTTKEGLTDVSGILSVANLAKGNYLAFVEFDGDAEFAQVSVLETVTIEETNVSGINHTGDDRKDIQAAIDAANPGDIIYLGNYDYTNVSDINITKDLTILGDGTTITSAGDGKAVFNIPSIADGGSSNVNITGIEFKVNNGDVVVLANAQNGTNPYAIETAAINIENNEISLANEDVVAESVTVLQLNSQRGVLAPTSEIKVSGNTLSAGVNPFEFSITSVTDGCDTHIPSGEFSTEKVATVIEYSDMVTTAVDTDTDGRIGEYFKVILKDVDGNILAGKAVQIGFNGKIYNRTTDENGSCQLQINLVRSDIYTFAVSFLGDDMYNGTFVVAKITVNKQKPSLTVPNKSYKASATTKTLTATFKAASGKPVANKKVTFTVNGKTYSATTNSNGVASVKVSLSTKKTYSFTVKFAGDGTYDAITKTAKVTIT